MLSIDTGAITSTVAALRTAAAGIGTELAQLEATSNALAGAWSGDAQVAYAQAHQKWSRSLYELRGLLEAASSVASDAATRYELTEQRVTATWKL